MQVYDIHFSDGKSCRCIVPFPADDEAEDLNQLRIGFHPGYVTEIVKVIPPPPTKLPWRRDGEVWRIGSFELRKEVDQFVCVWPGGEVSGGKDVISAAVRENWSAHA